MNHFKLGLYWPWWPLRSSQTLDLSHTASIYYVHMLFKQVFKLGLIWPSWPLWPLRSSLTFDLIPIASIYYVYILSKLFLMP